MSRFIFLRFSSNEKVLVIISLPFALNNSKRTFLSAPPTNTLISLLNGTGLTKILLYDGDNDTLSFGSAIDGGTY